MTLRFLLVAAFITLPALAQDRIFLKSGDILQMKVESIDERHAYVTNALNRLSIKLDHIDHIEYADSEQAAFAPAGTKLEQNWQVSHRIEEKIVLWNRQTKEKKVIARTKATGKVLTDIFPTLWGLFAHSGNFIPTGELASFVGSGFHFGAQAAHKTEFSLSWFRFFVSAELVYGSNTGSNFGNAINTFHLAAAMNWSLLRNQYGRLFVGFGGGPALLTVKNSAESQTDFTGMITPTAGAELFVLPYLSLRAAFSYQAYLQSKSQNFTGAFISLSIGYYFL